MYGTMSNLIMDSHICCQIMSLVTQSHCTQAQLPPKPLYLSTAAPKAANLSTVGASALYLLSTLR